MFFNIQVSMEDFLAGDSGVNALLPVVAEPKHEPEPAPTPLPRGRMEQTAKILYRRPEPVTRKFVLKRYFISQTACVKPQNVILPNTAML